MSVKCCSRCQKQGRCHDSRQMRDYVRRRYHCECGHTWTTAEFLVEEGDSRDKYKVRHYRERQAKAQAAAIIGRIHEELSR